MPSTGCVRRGYRLGPTGAPHARDPSPVGPSGPRRLPGVRPQAPGGSHKPRGLRKVEAEDTAPVEPPPDCDGFEAPAEPRPGRDEACLREPDVGALDPVVEWNSDTAGLYATDPHIKHHITPVVANLTDDDGDGDIDTDDIPDIAYTTYAASPAPRCG